MGSHSHTVVVSFPYSGSLIPIQWGLIPSLSSRLAFSLSVLCVLSAAFSGFFLSVATVMGKACGSHGNFSELLVNVIDRPQTWSEEDSAHYPLAAVILDRPQYTLTVAGTLAACRVNVSLFHALHLEQRYDLADRIWLNPQEKARVQY